MMHPTVKLGGEAFKKDLDDVSGENIESVLNVLLNTNNREVFITAADRIINALKRNDVAVKYAPLLKEHLRGLFVRWMLDEYALPPLVRLTAELFRERMGDWGQ